MLVDIIIAHVVSMTRWSLFSAVLPIRLESTLTQLKSMTHPIETNGKWFKFHKNSSLIDKELVLSKETTRTFWFSADSQENSLKIHIFLIQTLVKWSEQPHAQMKFSFSRCQLYSILKPMQSTLVICKSNWSTSMTRDLTGQLIKIWNQTSENNEKRIQNTL